MTSTQLWPWYRFIGRSRSFGQNTNRTQALAVGQGVAASMAVRNGLGTHQRELTQDAVEGILKVSNLLVWDVEFRIH
jgi:hypothetical protein